MDVQAQLQRMGFEITETHTWGYIIKRHGIVHAFVNTNLMAVFVDIPSGWKWGIEHRHPYKMVDNLDQLNRMVR